MLERLDNKYIVRQSVLKQFTGILAEAFNVLEIEGKQCFAYETCYFDDAQYTCYFEHHQGQLRRCKIRVRRYTDAQSCFVEVKLKDKRGRTVKKRLEYPVDKYGVLDEQALEYIRTSYSNLYGREFVLPLRPVLDISYRRVTLVAKKGGERVSIDTDIVFSGGGRSYATGDSIAIIETKSVNGNGVADKALRRLHQHSTRNCSKYCLGAVLLQLVHKYNKFLPALRKINAVLGTQRQRQDRLGIVW